MSLLKAQIGGQLLEAIKCASNEICMHREQWQNVYIMVPEYMQTYLIAYITMTYGNQYHFQSNEGVNISRITSFARLGNIIPGYERDWIVAYSSDFAELGKEPIRVAFPYFETIKPAVDSELNREKIKRN